MPECNLCKMKTINIGIHLKKAHYKCLECNKWFMNKDAHIKKICKLCTEEFCFLHLHLKEKHFHCEVCNKWTNNKEEHLLLICDKCNMKVCNINYHKSVFINCQEMKIIGANPVSLQLTPKFVTVKCNNCKTKQHRECNCYKYPLKKPKLQ